MIIAQVCLRLATIKGLTRLFMLLANTTSNPDNAFCSFYDASLNIASRALSSEDGLPEDFVAFLEWTLARSTPDLEPSQALLTLSPPSVGCKRRGSASRSGRQSPRLQPGPPDPRHPPGSLALHLRSSNHLLHRRWSAPWSQKPSRLHDSSLRRFHRGPSSRLWPGSCCSPGPFCLFPGSSLCRPPGLCLPAPSWVSILLQKHLPSSHLGLND